jgi:hypothetical protein
MPYKVVKRGKKWRLVKPGTGKVAKGRGASPVDGGGHSSRGRALAQARAIMASEHRRKG